MKCTKCGREQEKELCHSCYRKDYYQRNKESLRKYNRKYYKEYDQDPDKYEKQKMRARLYMQRKRMEAKSNCKNIYMG